MVATSNATGGSERYRSEPHVILEELELSQDLSGLHRQGQRTRELHLAGDLALSQKAPGKGRRGDQAHLTSERIDGRHVGDDRPLRRQASSARHRSNP